MKKKAAPKKKTPIIDEHHGVDVKINQDNELVNDGPNAGKYSNMSAEQWEELKQKISQISLADMTPEQAIDVATNNPRFFMSYIFMKSLPEFKSIIHLLNDFAKCEETQIMVLALEDIEANTGSWIANGPSPALRETKMEDSGTETIIQDVDAKDLMNEENADVLPMVKKAKLPAKKTTSKKKKKK